MKAAGCHRIQFGVEQGTEEGLLRLKKDVSSAEIEHAFALCREVGVRTVAYFMIGTPTMNVTGLCADGREIPIMRAGRFVEAITA